MKSKGFTLIELLATIIIMGIIVTIGFVGITNVSKSIRESQRNNVIKRIEAAASNYAYDRGEYIIFVNDLVTNGYLEVSADNDDVIDPVNNKRLNCYPVKMVQKGKFYVATFIDDDSFGTDTCNEEKLLNEYLVIKLRVYANNELVNNDVLSNVSSWLSGNIAIEAYSVGLDIDCNKNSCRWNNTLGTNRLEIPNDSTKKENEYTFAYEYQDENGITKTVRQNITIRIDNSNAYN